MKTLLGTSVVAFILLGGANLASAGSFNSFDVGVSAILYTPAMPTGISYAQTPGTAGSSNPPPTMQPTGTITTNTPFTSAYGDDGVHLVAGELAGQVDLPFGDAGGTKSGASVGFTLSNSTNAAVSVPLSVSYSATLITHFGGGGVATADYNLYLYDKTDSTTITETLIAKDMLYDMNTNSNVPFKLVPLNNISIPANESSTFYLVAQIGGTAAVPEPSSIVLLGVASVGLLTIARRRRGANVT